MSYGHNQQTGGLRKAFSLVRRLAVSVSLSVLTGYGVAQEKQVEGELDGERPKAIAPRSTSNIEELVLVERGALPVIISAPHGGTLRISGVPTRKGEGMQTGPAGFFTGRDGGTEELAKEVVLAIEKKLGARPYSVISSAHRRYLDPNRPAEIAYEDEDAKPVYDRYHANCRSHCDEIMSRFRGGLFLDLHGQGSSSQTVFRGTGNGKTVSRLRERFGEESHTGDSSFFGILNDLGWRVYPKPYGGKEQSGFTGGYIVQTYGSHRAEGIDAIQLEFGAEYRNEANRKETAAVLAEAVSRYLEIYVPYQK
ncbi:MAG: hypothetical protein ACK5PZ_15510 [Pirellula sp.]|jgi:N-formylglutamate amidohydrolase